MNANCGNKDNTGTETMLLTPEPFRFGPGMGGRGDSEILTDCSGCFYFIFLRLFAYIITEQRPKMETFPVELPSSTAIWEAKRGVFKTLWA